jgi:maleylacetoacetate isomerase
MKLVLYSYWRSSSSYRVRLALGLKRIAFDTVTVNLLTEEQRAPAHLARNPMGQVPCLLIDGKPFAESVAILELLDDLFPEHPLYPKDPFGRARVRALVEVVNSGTQPLQNLLVLQRLSSDPQVRKDWLRFFLPRGLGAFEAYLEANEREGVKGPFAYGEAPTAADVCLVPQVYSARRFAIDLAPFPRALRAEAALQALDAAKAAAPDAQPDAVPEKA